MLSFGGGCRETDGAATPKHAVEKTEGATAGCAPGEVAMGLSSVTDVVLDHPLRVTASGRSYDFRPGETQCVARWEGELAVSWAACRSRKPAKPRAEKRNRRVPGPRAFGRAARSSAPAPDDHSLEL
jgi:hypothetical protein